MPEPLQQRTLGIDYGQVRIGLALSDPLGILAQPLEVVRRRNDAQLAGEIAERARQWDVGRIVLGLPRRMEGEIGPEAERALAFGEILKAELPGVELVMWDERLTTAQVERVLIEANVSRRKRKQHIDKLAATVILQNYLDYAGNQRAAAKRQSEEEGNEEEE